MNLYINHNIEEIKNGVKLCEISLNLSKNLTNILIKNKGLMYDFKKEEILEEDIETLIIYGVLSHIDNHYNLIPNLGESFFGIDSKCFLEEYQSLQNVVGLFEIPYYSGMYKHNYSVESMRDLKESSYKFPDPNISEWFTAEYVNNTGKVIYDFGFLRLQKKNIMEKEILSLSYKIFNKENTELTPLFIGGDHAISYPIIKGLKNARPKNKLRVIYLDAHSDLSESGEYLTHSNVFSKILDLGEIELINYGIRGPLSFEEIRKVNNKILNFNNIDKLIEHLICNPTVDTYLSIDLDVFNPTLISSVTFPVPGGLNIEDFLYFLNKLIVNDVNIIGADIVEYNASYDSNRVGAINSSAIIYQVLKTLQNI